MVRGVGDEGCGDDGVNDEGWTEVRYEGEGMKWVCGGG